MQLADFKDKTWEHVLGACDKPILLALSRDDELVDAAKLIEDHGPEAGAAYIVAVLMAKHNPMMAINAATHYYDKLAKAHGMDELRHALYKMEEWTAWGGCPFTAPHPTVKWPVEPPEEVLTQHAGMLNFLLHEGSKRLEKSSSSQLLALMGVREFLSWLCDKGGLQNVKRTTAKRRRKSYSRQPSGERLSCTARGVRKCRGSVRTAGGRSVRTAAR
jgi:hypothetical protein